MRSFFIRPAIYFATAFFSLLSCQKSGVSPNEEGAGTPLSAAAAPLSKVERMRKFLSITLNVDREQVIYQAERQEFSVLGTLKFDYASTEARYDEANEYKLKYE